MSVVQDPPQSPDRVPDSLRDAHGAVGQPLARVDGEVKVAGAARFAAEVPLPNLTFAALAYSRIARGSIASIDTAEAEAAPGVVFVMTYRNAPRMPAPLLIMSDPRGAAGSSLPVMQDASIRWNGEPIALVIGETQEQADHAAGLIRVTYQRADADVSFERAGAKAKMPESILGEPSRVQIGDAEVALSAAPFKVDRTILVPRAPLVRDRGASHRAENHRARYGCQHLHARTRGSVGTFALESAIDELAEALELDPIVLRQRLEPAKDPSSGLAFSSRHLVEAYARGAKRFGWEKRRPKPGSLRVGDWLIGHGVATATYPYFRMDGGMASIRLFADGKAVVRMASHEMGWEPRPCRRNTPRIVSACPSSG